MRYPVLSFNAGELSPQIDARSDISKYRSGCRILENMIPRIYGPAERRPGTKYIETLDNVGRVVPFIYSNTIAYIVVFEQFKLQFYYNGGRVLDALGQPYYIDTDYLGSDIAQIQYKQSNDVMWLVHPSYPPRKLTRTSATEFALTDITFTDGPFKKRNDLAEDDGVTMTPSVTTGTGTLTASSATFAVGHVGALFSVTHPRVNIKVGGSASGTGVIDTTLLVEGDYSFDTHGRWSATVELQRSIDDGSTWESVGSWTSVSSDRNVQFSGTEHDAGVLYRINVTAYSGGTISAYLRVNSSTQTGICRVTGYSSETLVTITVLKDFASATADTRWAEGCWSQYRGYPVSVTFFESRCLYAGTPHQPQTVWLSRTDDFENFTICIKDDASFSLTMSSDTRNAIQWISALEAIIVGTTGGEWRIRSTAYDEALTPTNFSFKQQTSHGSTDLQALPVHDSILFADRVARKVREATYNGDKDKYVAPDLTALAEHITDSGITSMAFQKNPDPILWCTLTDGTLISCTYERDQNVVAWARHPMYSGGDITGTRAVTTEASNEYPTLQALPSSEIPDAPSAPAVSNGTTPVGTAVALQAINAAPTGSYYLTDDIDLDGVSWTPLANFAGTLDGQGYVISNLTIDQAASDNQGLIGSVGSDAKIKDLILDNFDITGRDGVSALVASQSSAGPLTVHNVVVRNSALTGENYVGAVIGIADSVQEASIRDCTASDNTITAVGYSGGMIGYITADSSPTDDINIVNCTVDGGAITHTESGIGGFVGLSEGEAGFSDEKVFFHGCTTSMQVISAQKDDSVQGTGGFAGTNIGWHWYVSCGSTGAMNITQGSELSWQAFGGFIGFDAGLGSFINCYATGDMTFDCTSLDGGTQLIGGFIGKWDSNNNASNNTCKGCYATGNITFNNVEDDNSIDYVGGFCGALILAGTQGGNVIDRCYATGDITVDNWQNPPTDTNGAMGGFGNINSIATAPQTTTFQDCYAWGSIILETSWTVYGRQDTTMGGFLGSIQTSAGRLADVTCNRCYCAQTNTAAGSGLTGQLPNEDLVRGFIGRAADQNGVDDYHTVTVSASYWDVQTSGILRDDYAVGHETEWLQTQENYSDAGWDFDTVWVLTETAATTTYITGTGSIANSVAVIPSTDEDEVWLTVTRTINGADYRYLEQMQPRNVDDREDYWFVDCGLDYSGTEQTTFSGLSHLEGEELVVLADGAVQPRQTVSSGSITLPEAATRVIVGLPCRFRLKPMRFDIDAQMTTKGSLKRFAEVVISFYESLNVQYGVDVDNLFKIDWRTTEDYDSPPGLFTGDKVVTHEGGFSVEDSIVLTGDDPVPCTVRAMVPRIDLSGR
jgi:hypothetical protein